MGGEGALRERVVKAIEELGSATFEEIAERVGWSGDRRLLRSLLAELVREGVVVREPDYERRRMVFRVNRGRTS